MSRPNLDPAPIRRPDDHSLIDQERLVGLGIYPRDRSGRALRVQVDGQGRQGIRPDFAASDAIRGLFDTVAMCGLVTIGEGIKDNAPGIFKGEKLGTWCEGSLRMAIALDPIDGTTIVSKGLPGAISVIAAATVREAVDDPMSLAGRHSRAFT
jgi:fructose-1,6-bisphosphatase II